MNRPVHRRSRPPAVVAVVVGLVVVLALASTALGLVAWLEADRVRGLQSQVDAMRAQRNATEERLSALQATAAAMEGRLTAVESGDTARQLADLRATVEAATDARQLAEVRASLAELQAQVDSFQAGLDDLGARLSGLDSASGDTAQPPPAEVRWAVPRQRQSHSLSCEASAASMVAQYFGVDLSEEQVLASLPFNDNPHLGFRGNIDGPTGGLEDYGVYAGPIEAVLESHGLRADELEGGLEGLRAALAQGRLIIAWVTYDCLPSTPQQVSVGGQNVTLVPNQHVVVVTGYDAEGVWANDPYDGQEDYYSNGDLSRAMGYFGGMALEVAAP